MTTQPRPTAVPGTESTLGAFGKAAQGVILERLSIGVVLAGLVAIVAGLLEATGAVRVGAVLVGVASVVVPIVGWRRSWSDPVMWLAMLGCGVAAMLAFAVAVG